MLNLLRAEVYKISKSTAIKVCIILTCICSSALVFITHSIATGSMSEDISGSVSGLSEVMVISLLGSFMIGLVICNDFETKTIHDAVACGNGRFWLVISKLIIFIFTVMLLFLPYMISTIIGLSTGADFDTNLIPSTFSGILSDQSGITMTISSIGKVIIITLITILIYAAKLSVIIPLAFKIRKPVVITGIGFIYTIIIDLVIRLLEDIPGIKKLISITPFAKKFMMMEFNAGSKTIMTATLSSLIFIVIMTLLTYKLFKRDDIK